MKIQINTDVNIDGTEALAAHVSGRLHDHRGTASGAPLPGTESERR
jgi:hypothetical protein